MAAEEKPAADADQPNEEGEGKIAPKEPVVYKDPRDDPRPICHEPFSHKMHKIIAARQLVHGLRHHDYQQYRKHCSRRLRSLYITLDHKHADAKGRRFKQVSWPKHWELKDVRFLEIILMTAERDWAYSMELRGENAVALEFNKRKKKRMLKKLQKAVFWSAFLQRQCKIHGDRRLFLEAEAYYYWMCGVVSYEKPVHEKALEDLNRAYRIYELLGIASEQEDRVAYVARSESLAPMIRECRYHLGMGYTGADMEDESEQAPVGELSDFEYRGIKLCIPTPELKEKLETCVSLTADFKAAGSEDSKSVVIEYRRVCQEYRGAMRDIHAQLLDTVDVEGQGQSAQYRRVEAFGCELLCALGLEGHLLILRNYFSQLEQREDFKYSTRAPMKGKKRKKGKKGPPSSHSFRVDKGVRICEMLAKDIEGIEELPDTDETITDMLTAYSMVVRNCRCLCMALCFFAVGKLHESAAVFDLLHARLGDGGLGDALEGPLGRVHSLFGHVQQCTAPLVAKWRCKALAELCRQEILKKKKEAEAAKKQVAEEVTAEDPSDSPEKEKEKEKPKDKEKDGDKGKGEEEKRKWKTKDRDPVKIVEFPPRVREMAVKPLLFDLAFPCIKQPDFNEEPGETGTTAGGEGQQKKGIIGHVAGGIGSRIKGLWGGKK